MPAAEDCADNFLARTIAWASREDPIRALILVGSRVRDEPADDLADYDLSIFTTTHEPYTRDDPWMSAIGEVWVYIPEQIPIGDEVHPTRLVIFRGGTKVDLAFYPVYVLPKVCWDWPFRVLLDKDGTSAAIRQPAIAPLPPRPTQHDLTALVNEFWFEAYHVAKYLRRGDLWLVKFRDRTTKELLLRMIEWHERARHGWDCGTQHLGKGMRSWADPRTWQALHPAFAHFEDQDSWDALLATMDLFRRLGTETSHILSLAYPDDVDQNITGFVLRMMGEAARRGEGCTP